MKNVLHVISLPKRHGMEVQFLNFFKKMKEYDPELVKCNFVLAINISDYFFEELNILKLNLYPVYTKSKLPYQIIRKGKKIIKENNIEIVYGQNFYGNLIAYLLTFFNKKIKLITHEHGSSWNLSVISSLLTRLYLKKASISICNSIASSILLNKRFNLKKSKIRIVYNGVINESNELIDAEKKENNIIFIGRLHEVKSPQTIIYAMKKILVERSDINLNIVGDGYLKEDLILLTKELGLTDNIFFHGNVENVFPYIRKSKLLILPSIREALGNVIIEAGMNKVPVIASDVDGIPEVVLNKKTGILLKQTLPFNNKKTAAYVVDYKTGELRKPMRVDPENLAKVVLDLIDDNNILSNMGNEARNYLIEKFSFDKFYSDILKVLE